MFLQILADINPATPVLFCHAGAIYPKSLEYKQLIINRLGFTNIRETQKKETDTIPGDYDHVEWLMANYDGSNGAVETAIHLNQSLNCFDCWISAVYHKPIYNSQINRIDVYGKIIRVNPLLDWTQWDVDRFMKAHNLPFNRLAPKDPIYQKYKDNHQIPFYAYS